MCGREKRANRESAIYVYIRSVCFCVSYFSYQAAGEQAGKGAPARVYIVKLSRRLSSATAHSNHRSVHRCGGCLSARACERDRACEAARARALSRTGNIIREPYLALRPGADPRLVVVDRDYDDPEDRRAIITRGGEGRTIIGRNRA